MRLKIVNLIPTYNEKENILTLLSQLDLLSKKHPQYSWTTVIIDDNSPDGTGLLIKNFHPKFMRLILITGPKLGLGIAMRRGLNYLLKELDSDVVITNEADFAYDLNLIPKAISKIKNGFDVVLSNRHGNKNSVQGWNLNRKFNHFVANTIFASWIAGVTKIIDHNGAFRAVKIKSIVDSTNWDQFPSRGFGFFNFWTYLLTTQTSKIYQMPITYHFRSKGESKVSLNPKYLFIYFHDVFEYILLCFRIRFLIWKLI